MIYVVVCCEESSGAIVVVDIVRVKSGNTR